MSKKNTTSDIDGDKTGEDGSSSSKPKNIRKMSTNMGRFPALTAEDGSPRGPLSFLKKLKRRLTGNDSAVTEESDEEGEYPGGSIKVPEGFGKIDSSRAKQQLKEFFDRRKQKSEDVAERRPNVDWKPPPSWAVVKPVITRPLSPDLAAKLEMVNLSDSHEENNLWLMRVYRPTKKVSASDPFASDSLGLAFATLSVSPDTTMDQLYSSLAKKLCGTDAVGKLRLFVSYSGGDFILKPDDSPIQIQKQLLIRAGYLTKSEMDQVAKEDYSYICRWVFRELPTASTQWQLRFDIYRNRYGRKPSWFNVDRKMDVTPEKALLADENLAFLPSKVFEWAERLEKLDLKGNPLINLPDDLISSSKKLYVLRISHNFLKQVPTCLELLFDSLQFLDLSANNLGDSGVAVLANLKNLKHLNLSGNHLTTVPVLPSSLEQLNISNNLLSQLSFDQLLHLRELDVSLNFLSFIPELPNLEKLIAYGNQLQTGFTIMSSLRYLDISYNAHLEGTLIAKDSSCVTIRCDHTALTSIVVDGAPYLTELSCVGSMLTNITCTKRLELLRILDLRENRLSTLPDDLFKNLNMLERLYLDKNLLERLPSLEGCNQLIYVSVSYNQLTDLGMRDALPKLESLYAQRNNLKKISRTVWKSTLKELNLSGNYLTDFPHLEEHLNGAAILSDTLEFLSLAENNCSAEVFYSISELQNLKSLHLEMNQIYNFAEEVFFPKLKELSLAHNQISSIPESISKFSSIERLYLNNNRLISLPGELSECKNLRLLDVSDNNLKYNICNEPYDWNWNSNPTLSWLDLAGNAKLDLIKVASTNQKKHYFGKFHPGVLQHLNVVDLAILSEQISPLGDSVKVRTEWTEYPTVYPLAVSECPSAKGELGKHVIYDVSLGKFGDERSEGKEDLLVAIFDGKASPLVSAYLYQVYPEVFFSLMRSGSKKDSSIEDTIRMSFLTCNLQLSNQPLFDPKFLATGAITYLREESGKRFLYVANVGDVVVLLVQKDTYVVLTTEHTVINDMVRIKEAQAGLASPHMLIEGYISRAFGSFENTPFITACPSIVKKEINLEEDEYVLMVTSHIAKSLPFQLLADVMHQCEQNVTQACQRIRDYYLSLHPDSKESNVLAYSLKPQQADLIQSAHQVNPILYQGRRRKIREEVLDLSLAKLPKEIEPPEDHVALVFTDIRESTVLWESNPGAMRTAQKLHHLIMRRHLRLLGGYEVKTEGDAFMVSFPTPLIALKWCLTVQQELLKADWPDELLKLPACQPIYDIQEGDEEAELLFRGISVRMGMHWGTMDSEVDAVTGRMDYNGVPVIIASRVSSLAKGGQILITRAVYDAISAGEVESGTEVHYECFDLGRVKLKGIEATEQIYEAFPKELSNRRIYYT